MKVRDMLALVAGGYRIGVLHLRDGRSFAGGNAPIFIAFPYFSLLFPTFLKILRLGSERTRKTLDETPLSFETQLSPTHSMTWLSIVLVECLNLSQNVSSQMAEGFKLRGIRGSWHATKHNIFKKLSA